jgi:hypothetical protein
MRHPLGDIMSVSLRILAAAVAVATAVAAGAALGLPAMTAAAAPAGTTAPPGTAAPHGAAARPGRTARPITLATKVELDGYDAAADASGTTYIGWIASTLSVANRTVHLCTLPRGATTCRGGSQSIASLGASSAAGLRVLVTPRGKVTLVWFHDTTASENGPDGSQIAIATSQSGGTLSAAHDVATGPSFGSMLDAATGPGGNIWAVLAPSSGDSIQIRPGFSQSAVTRTAPYMVGNARLAFSGSTAVLAIQKAGAITHPVAFASDSRGSWSAFGNVARTWTSDAELGLTDARSGIRLIAAIDNASYFPVVSRWTGSRFSPRTVTGDRNSCSPNSHDTVSDASGRVADVSRECEQVAIANLTDTAHAAVARFNSGGTFAGGDPQIATNPSGRGWVAWSIEAGNTGNKLLAAPVLLPGRTVTAARRANGDRVTLRGPASCLPPVSTAVGVQGSPAAGSHVVQRMLLLGGRTLHSSTLNGASLRANTTFTLTGRVAFGGGARRTVTAHLKFRTCPTP